MKNYYEEIDRALQSYETGKSWHEKTMIWICDRIDWAWRWRKINKTEMEELADRAVKILRGE